MYLLPKYKPGDQPFHSPASFNVISIAGIHFAYISCCYVGQTSDKLCGRQEQPFVNRVCIIDVEGQGGTVPPPPLEMEAKNAGKMREEFGQNA